MMKAIYLVKRKAGMSFADFRRYQLEIHVPLASALPGLRRYTLDLFPPGDEADQPFDAAATVWFDDRAAHDAALASPEGQRALADLPNFLDMDAMKMLFGETAAARNDM